ncbi:sensor histidine kinase [Variovorax sp. LT1R16]|uniref:sensor histidine kinase n=1 Tax=Variovorax sp. LT1R16 TaxID=3443728 RepID=UPI003F45DCB0
MRAATPQPVAPSLTRRVLRGVLPPLALTWLVGTGIALGVANSFTEQAFDRTLLDDAYAVSSNVRATPDSVELTLTPREVTAVLFDQTEAVHFAVRQRDGRHLAGEAALQAPFPEGTARHRFSDITYQGEKLRAVVLDHSLPHPYRVVVAQTTRGRSALVGRLLVYSLAPQLLLLALVAAWLWRHIDRELRPLGELEQALGQRDASDLSPVPVARSSRELERLGDAMNALFGRVAFSVRAQREFAGNVAHELRTPLAGIRALADYGLAQTTPEIWREQLGRIAASQARASHLVDQLLGLALADEGRTALQREPVQLHDMVEQAVLRHLARADARGVDLGARGLEGASVTVQASVALIEGILDNLIDNALRYGGRTITVELSGTVLSVVDDGPGIPPAAQRALMERWAQGPDGQKLGQGAGLGLSIVARYAELLDAELRLEAAEPTGLRVSVVFGEVA